MKRPLQYYLLLFAIAMSSCVGKQESQVKLAQTRAAIDTRDAWREELKPIEIECANHINGMDKLCVWIKADEQTTIYSFNGKSGVYKPEQHGLTVDTASMAVACWPLCNQDTSILKAPFCNRLVGKEISRHISDKLNLKMKFRSTMAAIRFCFESEDITEILQTLSLKGEAIATEGVYLNYEGKWIESDGKGKPMAIDCECILNNGRNHDFYLIPTDVASDIVLTAKINNQEHVFKTKVPPLTAGSMTQLNLKAERGVLLPKSSWVDNDCTPSVSKICAVDTIRVGNYLRRDGIIVAKRDTMSVAVVLKTDGRHGTAIAIEDCDGLYNYGQKELGSGLIFCTIDGVREEGIINGRNDEEEHLVYKPEIPYPATCAFGHLDGAATSCRLLKSGKSSLFDEIEKRRGAYLPTLAEMAFVFYELQGYTKHNLSEQIEPLNGEYITCSESSPNTIYGIEMNKGIVMGNYSKQYANLKLRLFYIF